MGLFKTSRLITKPNPGTRSLPFGTDTCGVLVVLDELPAEGAAAAGAVVVWEVAVAGLSEVLGDDAVGAGGVAISAGDPVFVTGGASIAGGSGSGAATGLDGFTGLNTLVGFTRLSVQLFVVSIQGSTSGCP
jgi:hypothetical protein